MFAQDMPLCLTASICFEQLYNGVDGDSASSTELYGLLSSLSGIPINQSIAVTGSVNQKGQIQPIGGVNEKIEGYFQVCKVRGLDGSHGVMIPVQNIDNLQLSDEVIDAVKNKKFHVYAISTIEEGIEVLGASSDHTLLDIQEAKRELKIGDIVKFGMKYANTVFVTGREDIAKNIIE